MTFLKRKAWALYRYSSQGLHATRGHYIDQVQDQVVLPFVYCYMAVPEDGYWVRSLVVNLKSFEVKERKYFLMDPRGRSGHDQH